MKIDPAERRRLLELARASLSHGLSSGRALPVVLPEWPAHLCEPAASFVTLRRVDQLLGCIGSLEACRPLVQDIAENAYAASARDPRFAPLRSAELAEAVVEISVLTPPQALSVASERELLAQLQPGVDGLILEWQGRRSTFLPTVWRQLPRPSDFLGRLRLKAGLKAEFWASGMTFYRYQTISFREESMPRGQARAEAPS
ncbi:MAG: AmmeMemoRadiSam system protein A [Nitrococcus mobilis]|nr:AmmeMemoRadiSam system protein A [Nitrococcus mobilis]